jgi:hypothetical protein
VYDWNSLARNKYLLVLSGIYLSIPSLVKSKAGKYQIRNLAKYAGKHEHGIIKYRSRWEYHVMKMFDDNPNVISWANEPFPIMYLSPVDGIWHRYFPDFYVYLRKRDGSYVKGLIEVKPKMQTEMPRVRKRKSKRSLIEAATYGVNEAKWAAATAFAHERGWFFQLMTEDDIFK